MPFGISKGFFNLLQWETTNLELSICLGALQQWYHGLFRQMYLAGKRKPINISICHCFFLSGGIRVVTHLSLRVRDRLR